MKVFEEIRDAADEIIKEIADRKDSFRILVMAEKIAKVCDTMLDAEKEISDWTRRKEEIDAEAEESVRRLTEAVKNI
jgi:hypothetical protein